MNTQATVLPAVDLTLHPLPLKQMLPWVILVSLLSLLAIYFVGVEQGALSMLAGREVHEFVHDGRHLLGFPCH